MQLIKIKIDTHLRKINTTKRFSCKYGKTKSKDILNKLKFT